MRHYIATGFQNTVDFELQWNTNTVCDLIISHNIHNSEITSNAPIHSERDILIALLGFMKTGNGGERFVSSSDITRSFASHFSYKITLGGTPVRAAVSMGKLGYHCCLHACSFNRYFRELIPSTVDWIASVPDEGDDFHPHVILQFPRGTHIKANDIDFVTPRPNRAIFDYDLPSKRLIINNNFQSMASNAKVFLAAGYNVIEDKTLLQKRLDSTIHIMQRLPRECTVIYEDGDHEDLSIGRYTIQVLAPHLDVLSLNEDELQRYVEHPVDITNPHETATAILELYSQANVPVLVCHSAYWALAYGEHASRFKDALEGAILMASTRFRIGDNFTESDYEETRSIPARHSSIEFCKELSKLLGEERLLCLPGLDMDYISHPVTIGLGDAFIGGFLPGLLNEKDRQYTKGLI